MTKTEHERIIFLSFPLDPNFHVHLFGASSNPACAAPTHLFAGDILEVFLHHDLPQTVFDLTLGQLSFCRSAEIT